MQDSSSERAIHSAGRISLSLVWAALYVCEQASSLSNEYMIMFYIRIHESYSEGYRGRGMSRELPPYEAFMPASSTLMPHPAPLRHDCDAPGSPH